LSKHPILRPAVAVLAFAVLAGATFARAEDKKLGWADTAELSYVLTAGNSQTTTLGFKDTLIRTWADALFTLKAGGIRSKATTPRWSAVAPDPNDLTIFEIVDGASEVSAENYYFSAAYDRNVSKAFYWHVGAGWDRNQFAGIDNRYVGEAGVGNVWKDTDHLRFRTTYSATYTAQKETVDNPALKNNFIGARLISDYLQKLGANTTYVNTLVLDENLDETKDWRADMINSVAVSMSRNLALKASLQWLYDNTPSFKEVDLLLSDGSSTGLKVPVELKKLDTIFTTSLVVNF